MSVVIVSYVVSVASACIAFLFALYSARILLKAEKLRKNLDILEETNKNLTGLIDSLKLLIVQLQGENTELQKKVEGLQTQVRDLQAQIKKLISSTGGK